MVAAGDWGIGGNNWGLGRGSWSGQAVEPITLCEKERDPSDLKWWGMKKRRGNG